MDKRKIAESIYVFICDDVRHEINNKVSIIGLYDDIFVMEIPAILPKLNFVIQLKKIKYDVKSVKVIMKAPNGEVVDLPKIKLAPNKAMGSNHSFEMCIAPFKIAEIGKYLWEVTIDDEEKPSIVHVLNIGLMDQPRAPKTK